MINEEKKYEYWNHFTGDAHKSFRPKKITDIRLKLIKKVVLNDDFLWRKVIERHNALGKSPNELEETSLPDYRGARVDFWGLIREKINASINFRLEGQ